MAKRYYLFIAHGSREETAHLGFQTLLETLGKLLLPNSGEGLKNLGRSRLLITKYGSEFSAVVISYVPSQEFKGNIKNINAQNFKSQRFDGKITLQKVGNNVLHIWQVSKGDVVENKTARKSVNGSSQRTNGTWFEQRIDWFQFTNAGSEPVFLGSTWTTWYEEDNISDVGVGSPYDCYGSWAGPWCGDAGVGGVGAVVNGSSSGGSSEPIYFDPSYVVNLGDKPIFEYADKCQGLQDMWNNYPSNEVAGYVTSNGQLLVTGILSQQGGSSGGTYEYNGITYYPYPKSQGAPSNNYAGMQENSSYYFIPVIASFHTHTPCLTDGTNGVSQAVSPDDHDAAINHPNINHWVIGCGAIAQFNGNNANFFNVQSGPLSTICANVQ